MALEMKQGIKQAQTVQLSPQIQQAIKILVLNRQELETLVAEEIRENPTLEEVDSSAETGEVTPLGDDINAYGNDGYDQLANTVSASEEIDEMRGIDDLVQRFQESLAPAEERSLEAAEAREKPGYELVDVRESFLHEDIEDQIAMMHLTHYERECVLLLLQYMGDDGYVHTALEAIAKENSVDIDDLEFALRTIQECEPIGVGARDLRECLLLQLSVIENPPHLVRYILEKCWPEFEKQDVVKIARLSKESQDDVKKALAYVRANLDPRPARQYGGDANSAVVPDVFVFKRDGKWVVSINEEGLPRLRISPKYENLVREIVDAQQTGGKSSPEGKSAGVAKSFLNEKIRNAKWILRAISERNRTIVRVMEVVLEKQEEFFEHGINHLKPLTLKAVADVLGLHESTVSRATTQKYVHCPRGVFELKYFFKTAVGEEQGHSNETVKNWVGEYIKAEQPGAVLSDQDIADLIDKEKHVKVARRTVAKYREALGLLPSSKRAKHLLEK
jgi:RNA polymerase sigma-54 factor